MVFGGSFEGERLSGEVLDGSNDWQVVGGDETTKLDGRLVLKTTGGAMIGMTYHGVRHGPAEVVARLEAGGVVDASSYYFRIAPFFETASTEHAWLNGVLALGLGHRREDGPVYSVFELQ